MVAAAGRAKARTHGLALALALCVSAVACAGPQYDGRVFKNDEVAFRIGPPPSGWRAIDASEAVLAFRDDAHLATVAVNARCHRDGDDVPLQALTHHLFLQFTGRERVAQKELMLDGRAALMTELRAELDGVPKHFVVYVLKKDGCVYDFLWIGDHQNDPGQEAFSNFVGSFKTVPR